MRGTVVRSHPPLCDAFTGFPNKQCAAARDSHTSSPNLAEANIIILKWVTGKQYAKRQCQQNPAVFAHWHREFDRITAQARAVQQAALPNKLLHWQVVLEEPYADWERVVHDFGTREVYEVARNNITWTSKIVAFHRLRHKAWRSGDVPDELEAASEAVAGMTVIRQHGPRHVVVHPFITQWTAKLHPAAWPKEREVLAMGVWGVARVFKQHIGQDAVDYYLRRGPVATVEKYCDEETLTAGEGSNAIIPCLRAALLTQLTAAEGAGKPVVMQEFFPSSLQDAAADRNMFNLEAAEDQELHSHFCLQPSGDDWARSSICECAPTVPLRAVGCPQPSPWTLTQVAAILAHVPGRIRAAAAHRPSASSWLHCGPLHASCTLLVGLLGPAGLEHPGCVHPSW